jgi:alkylated DNA repair protein alkB homolog 8
LVVANGGLGNGVDREQLWYLFEKYGKIVDIVMKPRKPYAFVSFQTVEEAERAMKELNGHRLEDSNVDGPLLYLLYVKECNHLCCMCLGLLKSGPLLCVKKN